MTRPLYAPITSHLVVRKGEAKPWEMSGALELAPAPAAASAKVPAGHVFSAGHEVVMSPSEWRAREAVTPREPEWQPRPAQSIGATSHDDGIDAPAKRCSIRLSHEEYERLGIIGVKKEMTRQAVLREAIEQYLAAAANEYRMRCGCLEGQCRGDC